MNKGVIICTLSPATQGKSSDITLNIYVCMLEQSHTILQSIIETLYRIIEMFTCWNILSVDKMLSAMGGLEKEPFACLLFLFFCPGKI